MPLQLWPAEQEAIRPPEDLTLSQWAEQYRVLDENSSEAGPWRNERTPYLVGIMDALTDPAIEEITVVKATQMGVTEAALNWLGYIVDQDPGPCMLVYPRKEDCDYMSDTRVRRMLETNPRISRHMTRWKRDQKKHQLHFDRATAYFGASTSPADLASKAIRYLLLDELDRYQHWLVGEGNPLDIVRKRTRTFWNRKVFKFSSPTTPQGNIWQEWLKSDRRRRWCQCTQCRAYQPLIWDSVKWPKEIREPDRIKNGLLAAYRCAHCGHLIEDGLDGTERDTFLRSGIWVPDGAKVRNDGTVVGAQPTSHAGFHISALYSPWTTWSWLASKWIQVQKQVESLQVFINTELAEVWEEKAFERTVTELRHWILPYRSGTVPAGAEVLTCGIDVQADHYFYVVRAWARSLESWLVEAGRCENWTSVENEVLDGLWGDHQIKLVCIDSGYDTWEIYEQCAKSHGLMRPIKGASRELRRLYEATTVTVNKKTGKPIPGGLQLWTLDTARLKERILRFQSTREDQAGGWHIPEDVSDEYLEHMSNERKVFDRNLNHGRGGYVWKVRWAGAPQHFWDCEVYATAAADMLGVGNKKFPAKRASDPKDTRGAAKKPWFQKRRRGTWLNPPR